MATPTIRNLPDAPGGPEGVGGSEQSVEPETHFVDGWLGAAAQLRGEPLPVPARSQPREVDLG